MDQSTCSIDGCSNPVHCRSLCPKHYYRLRVHGSPELTVKPRHSRRTCAIDGCNQARRKRDWCSKHYSRWRKNGSPEDSDQSWTVDPRRSTCLYCQSSIPENHQSRRYCSDSCSVIFSRDGGPRVAQECALCGEEIAFTEQGGRSTRRKRKDALLCSKCRRPHLTPYIAEIVDRDGTDCGICGRAVDLWLPFPEGDSSSVDHVVPRSLGGGDDISNYQLAHLRCNILKGNRVS